MKISHVVSLIVFCMMSIDNALAEDYKDVSYKHDKDHGASETVRLL